MWPLTCGAMPTKLARTVASSVCGRVSHCSSVTTTAMAAPATIAAPITRPARRRAPESPSALSGVIGLHPEQRHPENQGDENREARIDECSRAEVRVHADAEKEPPRDHGNTDADRGAEHPRRKKRADDVDLRSHGSPLSIRRDAGVRDLARCEREGRRGLQQLNLRVELYESRATQLAPGDEKVAERAEPHTVRLQRVLVRLLRGIQQRGRDVEASEIGRAHV